MTTESYSYPPSPPYRRSAAGTVFRFLMGTAFGISVGLNLLALFVIGVIASFRPSEVTSLEEHLHAGDSKARNKVAIVHIDGLILEGLIDYAREQIQAAALDERIKSVVVRINSPGGSITASDDLFQRIRRLNIGDADRETPAKPVIVSMAGIATSGGYYIAMPSKHIFAERTTITGSIGVYAAFPNVSELAQKWGVKMNVIKRGEVKDSGSMFHEMSPQERHLWQDMIDHAYEEFLTIVHKGRGDKLKFGLREEIPDEKRTIPGAAPGEKVDYVRRLADGGVFTSDNALKYGLVDQIGYLDDAIAAAANQAGLGRDYQVVTYKRPRTWLDFVLGTDASASSFDPAKLADGVMPRIWYLMPESGLAGMLGATATRIR
jgi:protease-4